MREQKSDQVKKRQALEILRTLAASTKRNFSTYRIRFNPETAYMYNYGHNGEPHVLHPVLQLIKRDWFSRLWVYQEKHVAR